MLKVKKNELDMIHMYGPMFPKRGIGDLHKSPPSQSVFSFTLHFLPVVFANAVITPGKGNSSPKLGWDLFEVYFQMVMSFAAFDLTQFCSSATKEFFL